MWLCTGVASVTINHCDHLKTTQVCETQVFHPGLERGKRQPLALVGIYYSIVLEDAACCSVLQCVALQYRTGRCGTPKSEVKEGLTREFQLHFLCCFIENNEGIHHHRQCSTEADDREFRNNIQ